MGAAASTMGKQLLETSDDEKKISRLKMDIMVLQKRNLLLKNKKLELEIEALKGKS